MIPEKLEECPDCGEASDKWHYDAQKCGVCGHDSLRSATVLIRAEKLITVIRDDGGYKTVKCIACGRCGWEGRLKHVPGCAVANILGHEEKEKP